MNIITKTEQTPIQPRHINTKRHFFESFDKMEREISARACVSLAQKNGGWVPFTKAAINKHWNEVVTFNGLDDMGYLVLKDGRYYYTMEFVAKCYASSPSKESK